MLIPYLSIHHHIHSFIVMNEREGMTDGETYGRTEGQKDRRTEGQKDRHTD
ncbi:hypothetical protein [Paenibacillus sp. FSL R5-0923]|uniref:hypothetical protein n=1 Tax=Paenibacillus sp. FSL R5-0923 TaxID=2921666 RepID=UPI0030F7805B